ncbi:hypothetical protein B0H14DRAFT_3424783 [Mycena olivaceomarginata]|nr:hypothetical protein B0H14DRAFT_3424783 [Mycena olivaceomarginata]
MREVLVAHKKHINTLPGTSKSNPLHVAVPPRIVEPNVDSNPPRVAVPPHIVELSFDSNPPHVAVSSCIVEPSVDSNVPHVAIPPRIVEPSVDSNLPHSPHPSSVHLRPIPSPCRSDESILLQFPPHPLDDSSPHIGLSIFDVLFLSPLIRRKLRKLINMMDRSNIGYKIPSFGKRADVHSRSTR